MSTRGSPQPDQHSIEFFGFETEGGSDSPLWKNYRLFFSDSQYQQLYREWKSTKRGFTEDEVTNGYWLLLIDEMPPYIVEFSNNKAMHGRHLFDENRGFQGDWDFSDTDVGKIVRSETPNQTQFYLFARQRGRTPLHSGLAFLKGENNPRYCKFIPIRQSG